MIGVPFMFLMVVTWFTGAIVFTCRINCNQCGADTSGIRNVKASVRSASYFFLFVVLLYAGMTVFIGYYNYQAFMGIRDSTTMMYDEAKNTDDSARSIISTIKQLNGGTLKQYTTNLPSTDSFEYILSETAVIFKESKSYTDSTYAYEVVRFSWIWVQLLLTIVVMALSYTAFRNTSQELMLKIMTYLLYFLLCTHIAYLSYLTSEFFIILDICEQLYNIVQFNTVPNTKLGIAVYLRPYSYEARGDTLSELYVTSVAYDDVMARVVKIFKERCPYDAVPTTREALETTFSSTNSSSCVREMTGERDAIRQLEGIILNLLDIRYHRHIRKIAQDSQVPLCVKSLNSMNYVFYGCVVWVILIFMIIVSVIRFATINAKKTELSNAGKI